MIMIFKNHRILMNFENYLILMNFENHGTLMNFENVRTSMNFKNHWTLMNAKNHRMFDEILDAALLYLLWTLLHNAALLLNPLFKPLPYSPNLPWFYYSFYYLFVLFITCLLFIPIFFRNYFIHYTDLRI